MSVDPRRTQPFCTPDDECYRECRCSRWPDYKNRWGNYVVPHDEGQEYYEKVLSYGPIAYWPLWETAGAVAECLVNPLQNGTVVGVTWNNVIGPDGVNGAPFFDGAADYINIFTATFSGAFNGATGSAMIWARVANVGVWTDTFSRHALNFQRSTGVANTIHVRKDNANNQFQWNYTAGGAAAIINRTPETTIDWVCVTLTWSDQANADETKAFWNGVQEGATSAAAGVWAVGALHATRTCIGAYGTAPSSVYHGWLAHAAVWDRVLTQPEITALATV